MRTTILSCCSTGRMQGKTVKVIKLCSLGLILLFDGAFLFLIFMTFFTDHCSYYAVNCFVYGNSL